MWSLLPSEHFLDSADAALVVVAELCLEALSCRFKDSGGFDLFTLVKSLLCACVVPGCCGDSHAQGEEQF